MIINLPGKHAFRVNFILVLFYSQQKIYFMKGIGKVMLVKTKHFGEIDLDEEKIITFENGIMGFEYCTKFTILYDNSKDEIPTISWLQSLDEVEVALPIINPLIIKEDYNPVMEEEILKPLGDLNEDNIAVFLIMTIPSDLTKMTVNLKAPIIANSDTKQGMQVIAENKDYEVKYNIYDILKARGDKEKC